MLRAQLLDHSFGHSPFSVVSLHTSIAGSYFVLLNRTDNTMQHNDFETKCCQIATKCSYLVEKLRLDLFVNFKP